MMNKVALLIGGNQGDRRRLIHQATEQIRQRIGSVVRASALYETAPWGSFDEHAPQNFLNCALLVETALTAHEVLEEALLIEALLGRLRPATPQTAVHAVADLPQRLYHSRPMDIDLIFFWSAVGSATPTCRYPIRGCTCAASCWNLWPRLCPSIGTPCWGKR